MANCCKNLYLFSVWLVKTKKKASFCLSPPGKQTPTPLFMEKVFFFLSENSFRVVCYPFFRSPMDFRNTHRFFGFWLQASKPPLAKKATAGDIVHSSEIVAKGATNRTDGGIHKFKSTLPMPRIPKSVWSGMFRPLMVGLRAQNWKIANQLDRAKISQIGTILQMALFLRRWSFKRGDKGKIPKAGFFLPTHSKVASARFFRFGALVRTPMASKTPKIAIQWKTAKTL